EHENQSALLAVDESIPEAALETALAAVLEHHDALRLRFRKAEHGWEQSHADEHGIVLERIDLSAMSPADRDRVQEEEAQDRQASLDLENGPLARAVLFDRGEEGRVLLLVLHHLVVDGVSWRILRDDLEQACAQAARGDAIDLGPRTTSYGDWSEALDAYAGSSALRDELAHWRAQGGDGIAPLPVDGRGGRTVADARSIAVRLEVDETEALLREVPAAYRTRIDDVLLCALAGAVGEWTGGARIRLALEGHGREEEVAPGADLTRTVGWFTSVYPVVLDLAGADGPGERLTRVKEQLRAIPRRGVGYGVLRYLSPDASVRRALALQPEPEILFNYLGQVDSGDGPAARLRFAAGPRGGESSLENTRRYAVEVNGSVSGGRLELSFTYGKGTHRRKTIQRVADAFAAELRALIAHCTAGGAGGLTPSDFPLAALTQAELDALLADRADVEDVYPLSPMQEGMLFHAVSGGGEQAYQVQVAQRIEGALDADLFRRAWDQAVARHPAFRTSFAWEGLKRPLQVVHATVDVPWTVGDWRGLSRDEQHAALDRFLAADAETGFALDQAPLLRFALFRTGEAEHWFVRSQHHLLTDGWASNRVADEVFRAYRASVAGTVAELPSVRPYRDYVAWLQRQDPAAAERYWRGVLAGFTAPTPLGVDRPALESGGRHRRHTVLVAFERTRRLEEAARRRGVTLNTLLQGAWALLLSRYSGEADVVFGATLSVRPAELEGVDEMVGLFINTLPVRVRVPSGERLDAWLGDLQRAQAEAREFDYAALVQVQAWSEVPRGTPLFESLFIFENYPAHGDADDAAAEPRVVEGLSGEQSTYPLTLMAAPGDELLLVLSYDDARFGAIAIERMMAHLELVLDQACDPEDRPLSTLVILPEAERRQLEARNDT
ncbi:MAG TPA: condensation domain-containing protein, partial [Longimicrobiaceae bacterium]|nr:condensation domain-containing protein [Longimicrobiaceae bacterium]